MTLLTASLVMMTIHYYWLWPPPTGASARALWGGCRDTYNWQSSKFNYDCQDESAVWWCSFCILLTYHILEIIDFSVCVPMFLSQSGAWVRSKAGQGRVPVSWRPRQSHLAIIRAELGPRVESDQWDTRHNTRWPITTRGPAATIIDLEKLTWILTGKKHQASDWEKSFECKCI